MYKIIFFTTEVTEATSTEVIENIWTGFWTYEEALLCVEEYDFALPLEWEWEIEATNVFMAGSAALE